MATEVIPNQKEILKNVLSLKNTIDRLAQEEASFKEEERLVRTILKKHDNSVDENISNLRRRIVQLLECQSKLPLLCDHCSGEQSVDIGCVKTMRAVCHVCKGTGLQKAKKG